MGVQGGGDLARLDAEAADAELIVEAPEELDLAVRSHADAVAGAVPPPALVDQEPLRRELVTVEVAGPDRNAADDQLAGVALRHGLQVLVDDLGLDSRDRAADRRGAVAVGRDRPGGGDDRGLAQPVVVDDGEAEAGRRPAPSARRPR